MTQQTKNSLTLIKWILLITLGWVAGFTLAVLSAELFDKIKLEFFAIGLGIAAGIGALQWVALRKQNHIGIQWIWLTMAGMGISFLLFDIVIIVLVAQTTIRMEGATFGVIATLAAAVGGYLVGYLQHQFILKQHYPGSERWILSSFLSWTLCSLFISGYFSIAGPPQSPVGAALNLIAAVMGGPIIGGITGKPILAILRSERGES